MIHALGVLSLLLYILALALFLADLSSGRSRRSQAAEKTLLAGFAAHTGLVIYTFLSSGTVVPTGRGDFYLFLSWGLPVAYAIVRRRMRFPIVGSFLTAAAIMFLASSSYLLHLTEPREASIGIGFQGLHVLPALIAELCLVIAVALSLIYAIQERRLKSKKAISAALFAPSLDQLNIWTLRLVSWGFVAMSFSVVTGSVWALFHQRSVLTADPFQWIGFLVWILFVAIHLVRSIKGDSGRTLSRMTIAAGIVLISSMCALLVVGAGVNHAVVYLS